MNKNWINREENIKLIVNGVIVIVSIILVSAYTFITTGYDISKVFEPKSLIDTAFISVVSVFVKYAVMDYTIIKKRSRAVYTIPIKIISAFKIYIESNKLLKPLNDYLDVKNADRKKRAYAGKLDKTIIKLDKQINKTSNEDKQKTLQDKLDALDKEKEEILNGTTDIKNKVVLYNRLTRSGIFQGSNIGSNNDIDISASTQSMFAKKNVKSTILTIFSVLLIGGVTKNLLDKADYFLLIIFLFNIITAIFLTYVVVAFLEDNEYIPRVETRKAIIVEFLDSKDIDYKALIKNHIKEEDYNDLKYKYQKLKNKHLKLTESTKYDDE